MPKEIFPSSFECDCGHQSDFFEHTVREMKAMSQKKKVYLPIRRTKSPKA
jgi:hypothetical protein